jgi:hypothetical protein
MEEVELSKESNYCVGDKFLDWFFQDYWKQDTGVEIVQYIDNWEHTRVYLTSDGVKHGFVFQQFCNLNNNEMILKIECMTYRFMGTNNMNLGGFPKNCFYVTKGDTDKRDRFLAFPKQKWVHDDWKSYELIRKEEEKKLENATLIHFLVAFLSFFLFLSVLAHSDWKSYGAILVLVRQELAHSDWKSYRAILVLVRQELAHSDWKSYELIRKEKEKYLKTQQENE